MERDGENDAQAAAQAPDGGSTAGQAAGQRAGAAFVFGTSRYSLDPVIYRQDSGVVTARSPARRFGFA